MSGGGGGKREGRGGGEEEEWQMKKEGDTGPAPNNNALSFVQLVAKHELLLFSIYHLVVKQH